MSKHLSWGRRLCDPLSLAREKDRVTLSPAVPGLLGADLSPHPGQDPKGAGVQHSPPVNPLNSSSFHSRAPARAPAGLRKPEAQPGVPTSPHPPILGSGFPEGFTECSSLPPAQAALPSQDQIPPPKQLKMTWAIFALGSSCKLPLKLAASHSPPDDCPPLLIPHPESLNKTGGLLETTDLRPSEGETEAMSQTQGWAENQASWVPAQVSFYCLAQPALYPRSRSL